MHKILSTTDYKKFKMMPGNRPVNKRVNRMISKVKQKNMLARYPILCTKNGTGLYIADGQHRFEAAKALGLPIFYIEAKDVTIEDVAIANNEQKAWTSHDYVESWIARGNQNYVILKRLHTEYDIPLTAAAEMLSDVWTSGSQRQSLVSGRFVIRSLALAEKCAALIRSIRPMLPFTIDKQLCGALTILMKIPAFDAKRFVKKLSEHPFEFHKCATRIQYTDLIERVYNFRSRASQLVPLSIEAEKIRRPSGRTLLSQGL